MANDKRFLVKNGLQTQNILFSDSAEGLQQITVSMLGTDTLSFSGNSGQLFSITDSASGTIFAVNDISGVPSIEVDDDGTIRLAELSGNVLIGTDSDDATTRLQVAGNVSATTFKGALVGNASTATTWATGRTISLTGDVTGTSGSFNGSGNLSFSTALAANTVSSTELVSASTLTIYNSAGSVLKTIIGAGS